MSTTEKIFTVFFGVLLFAFLILIVGLKIDTSTPIQYDYQSVVEVDKSEKVEWAISNAVQSVTSRNFVLTGIEITHRTFYCDKFVVKARGCERATILKIGE
jgi:hypothetical protein